jgi:hypothetical protein
MRFRYRFVGYGTRFSPASGTRPDRDSDPGKLYENELALDIGGVCMDSSDAELPVIDHHFFRESGQFPSASAAVLHKATIIAKRFGEREDDFWLVSHRNPDFDAFCAMYLARCILEGKIPADGWEALGLDPAGWLNSPAEIDWFKPEVDTWPSERRWPALLAAYAACVDNCRRIGCRKERALHSILYAAIHRGRDHGAEDDGALEFFDEAADRLRGSALNPLTDSVLESSPRFSEEARFLDGEVIVYQNDVRRARKVTVVVLEAKVPFKDWFSAVVNTPLLKKNGKFEAVHLQPPDQGRSPVDGIYLRDPKCLLFKEWARDDVDNSPMGKGFLFTAIAISNGRPDSAINQTDYYFSLDPERAGSRHLYNVWARLQAEEALSPNRVPKPDQPPRHGFEARAEGYREFFVDPWFDGNNYACTIVATPNRGTLIDKPGKAADLSDDRIAAIVADEVELSILSDVSLVDFAATAGPPAEASRTYPLIEALQQVPPTPTSCFRSCRLTLAENVDTRSGPLTFRVGRLLWSFLEGSAGAEVPPTFREDHLLVDPDGLVVWSRHGVAVALKTAASEDNKKSRGLELREGVKELAAIARETEVLLKTPSPGRGDPGWVAATERRVDEGERLMRRIVQFKFGLILPEGRFLRRFFEAIQLDEVVKILRDVNSADVQRAQAARMERGASEMGRHMETVAEVQSTFHWVEIFLISVYAVELFHALGESFRFIKLFVGIALVGVGIGAALFMLLGVPRDSRNKMPGHLKIFFVGMATVMIMFLMLGFVFFLEKSDEEKNEVDAKEPSRSRSAAQDDHAGPRIGTPGKTKGPPEREGGAEAAPLRPPSPASKANTPAPTAPGPTAPGPTAPGPTAPAPTAPAPITPVPSPRPPG